MAFLVLFTDLDGTLLDDAYSFEAALPALKAIRKASVPCVICSSKTRTEIAYYRKKLSNDHPFISENGGGIFIPKHYFGPAGSAPGCCTQQDHDYHIIPLGRPYAELRAALKAVRAEGFQVRGFGDMTTEEVARITGLDLSEARMAKEREFDEPFLFEGDEAARRGMLQSIRAKGLQHAEGHVFYHLMGNNDKGRAVSMVSALYRRSEAREIMTVALGDGPNDLPMLEAVDLPIVVQKPGRTYDRRFEGKSFTRADGVGPVGWNKAVLKLLQKGNFAL